MARQSVSNRQTLNWQQNYFRDSQDFSTSNWTKENVSITTSSISGPFGENITASILTENSATGNHSIYPVAGGIINMLQGSFWTFSAFFKAKERTYASLSIDMGVGGSNITVANLSGGGSISSTSNSTTTTIISRSINAKENGWYQLVMTMFQAETRGVLPRTGISANGTIITYAGDNASGIYVYQPQFVKANWAGFLTVTTSSAITTPIRNKIASRSAVSNRTLI